MNRDVNRTWCVRGAGEYVCVATTWHGKTNADLRATTINAPPLRGTRAVQVDAEVRARTEYEALTLAELRARLHSRGMLDPGFPRREPYIRLLLACAREDRLRQRHGGAGTELVSSAAADAALTSDIHTSGFEGLQVLLAGGSITCPICMGDVVRPVVRVPHTLLCKQTLAKILTAIAAA